MLPMATVPGAGNSGGVMEFMKPLARGLATIAVGGIGCFLFSTVGSLSYPPHGAILGAMLGLMVFLVVGCFITGFWRDMFFWGSVKARDSSFALLPSPVQAVITGHGRETLIVTVHEAIGVHVQGRALSWPDLFVEVECGINPTKRTCVKKDGKFNEQFRIQVDPTDKTMLFVLKDQDVFGASNVGFVSLDIRRQILEAEDPYPQRKHFHLDAGEGDTLRVGNNEAKAALVLSFNRLDSQGRVVTTLPDKTRAPADTRWVDNTHYGAVKYLSTLQFNPNATLAPSAGTRV
eukprot:TRINITY_DN31764_c0_g1_i1.p1 TRINITY_DN31764_c0_g1~~TRINITY_DN31764_c0_g1_i1.p1  ORF type:complete len:290 (-),score=53.47 TRINITY_DN31764_c0_g1_i1:68-937(-)